MRVLAAEDDGPLQRVLERSLRRWGYEPVMVSDGHEAWQILRHAGAPRLVVLDWDMPKLSGVEVCRMLRSAPHGCETYVVMLTGRHLKEDIVTALESGADDFLAKPFHARELQLRLAKGIRDVVQPRGASGRTELGTPPTGTTLGERYRLERPLAEGGMATVWLGVHLTLGINVAIKFMASELAATAAYASFDREARAAAQLRSEHCVRVYDHGVSADGLPYLVMEYLHGESLAERLAREKVLPVNELVAVVSQTARALGEAHACGIVHRDVKPENILLVEDPESPFGFSVKLIDFGLARPTETPGGRGTLAGTPLYMSPEYLRHVAAVSPALDLWALAATAYVGLVGVDAFAADDLRSTVRQVCQAPLPVPSSENPAVPPGFDVWFARACSRAPEERFPTANALASSLALACEQTGADTEPVPGSGSRGPESFAQTLEDTRGS